MKILAVDEEWWGRKRLKTLLKKVAPDAEIHMFDKFDNTLAFAKENVIDVAFIDLGGMQAPGFFLAQDILARQRTNIIFTNYERDYLKESFELRVSGYILKPLQYEDVLAELQNLRYPSSKCGRIERM